MSWETYFWCLFVFYFFIQSVKSFNLILYTDKRLITTHLKVTFSYVFMWTVWGKLVIITQALESMYDSYRIFVLYSFNLFIFNLYQIFFFSHWSFPPLFTHLFLSLKEENTSRQSVYVFHYMCISVHKDRKKQTSCKCCVQFIKQVP